MRKRYAYIGMLLVFTIIVLCTVADAYIDSTQYPIKPYSTPHALVLNFENEYELRLWFDQLKACAPANTQVHNANLQRRGGQWVIR